MIACVLLAFTSPLMLIVALMIKLESAGPVLEKQIRLGRGGGRFQMLRFRTTKYDPRRAAQITRVGQFLRYARIVALPELINVLRGEMSLFDPTKPSPSFVDN
jgi:lipopolysaccharide/colanic/teichoic acid biosynthesis glycosyltransferase